MRAFGVERPGDGVENSVHLEVPAPSRGPGQVEVEVRACAINAADAKIAGWRDKASFIHKKVSPLVLGYDLSGVVTEGAGDLKPGDEVFGFLPYTSKNAAGTLAERVSVDATTLARKPAEVSHADAAACATVGCTAIQALRDRATVGAGQRVLVNGASGGAGAYGVLVAKQLGAHVTALCSERKRAFARGLGADEVIDYRATPIGQLSGAYDAIYDVACSSSYGECKHILAPAGHYIVTLPSAAFLLGKLASLLSKRSAHFFGVQSKPADLALVAGWLAGGMSSAVTETFSFDDAHAALARYASGQATGKIAITME
jgi:NADPH:quinone reductase-like Zn-dependent oxidoreductase